MRSLPTFAIIVLAAAVAFPQQKNSIKAASQNPSPMVENTRTHTRIAQQNYQGIGFTIFDLLPKPVEVLIPKKSQNSPRLDLLLHFHGAGFVVQYAATQYKGAICAAAINLGVGSSVYGKAFEDSTRFLILLSSINDSLRQKLMPHVSLRKVILSGFSAGYGAIRKIISTQQNFARVDAILLLDGIHASYIPEGQVLAQGGLIDSSGVAAYVRFALEASRKNTGKKFLITHSEIFPGSYVSTTEATDFLLQKLGLSRKAILKWGPLGMQQLSIARRHHFEVRGFAGNTARDHVDHLHGLYYFLNDLMKL